MPHRSASGPELQDATRARIPSSSTEMDNPFSALESLCDVAAAVSAGASNGDDMSVDVKEVEAFNSVHDMIHAAINLRGGAATLQQIYTACQVRGRITHRRTGSSRLITQNENWKNQIRHALYTASRFKRCRKDSDYWMIGEPFVQHGYSTTQVVVALNEGVENMPQNVLSSEKMNGQEKRGENLKFTEQAHQSMKPSLPSHPQHPQEASPGSYLPWNKVWTSMYNNCGTGRIRSRCPVLGVAIPRKPRSIRRTYIFHTREGYMLSDTDSDPLPREVVNENMHLFAKGKQSTISSNVWHKPANGKQLDATLCFHVPMMMHGP